MARHPRSKCRRVPLALPLAIADALEPRQLLSTVILQTIAPILLHPSNPSQDTIDLTNYINDPQSADIVTSLGEIDLALTPTITPATVDNFAAYAAQGLYDGTIFSRNVNFTNDDAAASPTDPASIVQGGGFTASDSSSGITLSQVSQFDPIDNEASSQTSNVAGTISMAQNSGDPNSATSQFFFNVTDNSSVLDYGSDSNPQGFTAFGSITAGSSVLTALSELQTDTTTFSSDGLTAVPVTTTPPATSTASLVTVESVTIPSDCTYVAETNAPTILRPIVNNETGQLTFKYGSAGGTALVSIIATSNTTSNSEQTETFEVTIPPAAGTPGVSGPVVTAENFTVPTPTASTAPTLIYLLNPVTDSSSPITGGYFDGLSFPTLPSQGTLEQDSYLDSGITYTPTAGFTGTDSFQYTVSDASGATSAPATVTITVDPAPTVVDIGYHLPPLLHLTQPDGTVAVVRVTSGTGDIDLQGLNVSIATLPSGIFATGGTIAQITVNDVTDRAPSLTIQGVAGKGQGMITVGGITDTEGMFNIVARTTELTGTSAIAGVYNMTLDQASDATIDLTSGDTALSIGTAVDTVIEGGAYFRAIRVGNWTSDNAQQYFIQATAINSLVARGNFNEGLDLLGGAGGYTLGSARIDGTLGGQWNEPWQINGAADQISAASVASDGWGLPLYDPNATVMPSFNQDNRPYMLSRVAALNLSGNVTGIDVEASAIGAMSIAGNLADSTIAIQNAYLSHSVDLTRLSVRGAVTNTTISAPGNMGSITAASLTQSTISAGTVASLSQTGPLLDSADDLAAPAMISEVKLTAPTASFSDSRIAAARLGSMLLGTIVTSNGGVPLGLSAESIATIRAALDSGGSLRLSAKQLASESALTAYLAANSITLGDFAIDLFPAS